jgi:hypothetical protein
MGGHQTKVQNVGTSKKRDRRTFEEKQVENEGDRRKPKDSDIVKVGAVEGEAAASQVSDISIRAQQLRRQAGVPPAVQF